jgi:hypothetical protein
MAGAIYGNLCNRLIGFDWSNMSKSAELKEKVMPSADVSAFELASVIETESIWGSGAGLYCSGYN